METVTVNACVFPLDFPVSVQQTSSSISCKNMKNNLNESFEEIGDRRDIQLEGKVILVEGDGRCLFRSLVTAESPRLQKSRRNICGRLERKEVAAEETFEADILRSRVVRLMLDNLHFYSQLESGLINADQPFRLSYQKFLDRLEAMSKYNTMPGDLELNAAAMVLERQIYVLDRNLRIITVYGQDRYPQSTPVAVRYTRLRPDVGHYDAVVLSTDRDGDGRGDTGLSEKADEEENMCYSDISFSRSSPSCPSPRVCRFHSSLHSARLSTTSLFRNGRHRWLVSGNKSSSKQNMFKSRKCQSARWSTKKLKRKIGYKVFSEDRLPRRLKSRSEAVSRGESQCALCRKRLLLSMQCWMQCHLCGRPAHTQCVIKHKQCLANQSGSEVYFQCKVCCQSRRHCDSE